MTDNAKVSGQLETRTYEMTGTPEQLDVLERLFGRMTYLGQVGSSRWVRLYIDGDGAARIVVKKDGKYLPHDDIRSVGGSDAFFVTDYAGNIKADLG